MQVLVVDDNEDARIILDRVLRAAGHGVTAVAGGREALEALGAGHHDVVISDVLMPGMDGYELCRRVRASPEGRELPFVFYTSNFVDPEDARLARDLGASAFITKPADLTELMEALADILERLGRGELPVPPAPQEPPEALEQRHRQRLSAQLDDKVQALQATQRALESSQARLHHLVVETPVVVYGATPGLPRCFDYVSENAGRVLGIPAEALRRDEGLWAERVHPEDLPSVRDALDGARPGDRAALEYRFRCGDGTWCWLQDDFVVHPRAGSGPREIIGYWVDVSGRKRAERDVARSRDQLRRLSAQLQRVREEERRGIAREVHDDLGQLLTGIRLELAWVADRMAGDPALARRARSGRDLVDQAIDSVRALTRRLRPGLLEELGLADAAEALVAEQAERAGLAWDIRVDLGDLAPEPARDVALFRVLQEALTNVVRHARAQRVEVSLRRAGQGLELRVADDGIGVGAADPSDPHALGLAGMRERVLALGGSFRIGPAPAGGTEVRARVPAGGAAAAPATGSGSR